MVLSKKYSKTPIIFFPYTNYIETKFEKVGKSDESSEIEILKLNIEQLNKELQCSQDENDQQIKLNNGHLQEIERMKEKNGILKEAIQEMEHKNKELMVFKK